MKWILVAQGGDDPTFDAALKVTIKENDMDRLDVAVAYATLQGVKILANSVGGFPSQSRWVIGLDDAISQPEAIEYLLALKGADVRIAQLAPTGRFHPKLYCLWSSSAEEKCISALGSGNMTLNGFRTNAETAVILSAETPLEAKTLKKQWAAMWELGQDATSEAIAEYREKYEQARIHRRKIVDLGAAPPEPPPDAPVPPEPTYDGTPSSATIAWLEAGSPSAGGLDLEFPKAMMPFFALKKGKNSRLFRMANGATFTLVFTERLDNQMWRLLFSTASVQAAIGRNTMRPIAGGNRSDLAVAFRKIPGSNDFEVTMLTIGSREYQTMLRMSEKSGAVFSTRHPGGRRYGFI